LKLLISLILFGVKKNWGCQNSCGYVWYMPNWQILRSSLYSGLAFICRNFKKWNLKTLPFKSSRMMRCLFCKHDYQIADLVLTSPAICSFCILGHGNHYRVGSKLKSDVFLREHALKIARSPQMLHRLKCIVPCR
jgi:hypothetical protein